MIKNYLRVGLRNLMRHKFYSLLNVLGLAAGIACALLAVLYVDYHLQFDQHHKKSDRVYRVVRKVTDPGGTRYSLFTKPIAPVLKREFPEVEQAVRILPRGMWVHNEGHGFEVVVAIADKEVMDVLTIPMLQGDPEAGLSDPHSAFLSRTLAHNIFGDIDPIGQTVTVDYKWVQADFTVTGIFEDYPETTTRHLQFDFLTATFPNNNWKEVVWERWPSNWFVSPLVTYVLLREGADPDVLKEKLHTLAENNLLDGRREDVDYDLLRLSDEHLYAVRDYGVAEKNHGDIRRCYTLLAIGLLVLGIACMNYVNLITARSVGRAREVGLRKVVGAARYQLIYQFLGESILTTLFACVFAVFLAQASLPFFNMVLESQLALTDLSVGSVGLFAFFVVGVVGILAGSYPAFVLSAYEPVQALKSLLGDSRRAWLREGLVVTQFCASVVLVVGTVVVYQQTAYMQNKDLGFRQNDIVVMHFMFKDRSLWPKLETIKQQAATHANVVGMTTSHLLPGEINEVDKRMLRNEAGTEYKVYWTGIDESYLDVLDMKLVAGSALLGGSGRYHQVGETQAGEKLWETSILINETASKMMGLDDPVGTVLRTENEQIVYKVAGVVKDFHNQSLRFGIAPQMFQLTEQPKHVLVRLGNGDLVSAMAHLENVWDTFLPGRPFDYLFMDEQFNEFYKAEITLKKIYAFFAGLSILIGCLGMLGLVSYAAQQRTKEIGVRKVLGASTSNLMILLSKNFLILALIANVVAWPLAYFVTSSWLANFTYRIDLGVVPFLVTGLLTLVIVFLTVGSQAWRAARANPVDSLRYE